PSLARTDRRGRDQRTCGARPRARWLAHYACLQRGGHLARPPNRADDDHRREGDAPAPPWNGASRRLAMTRRARDLSGRASCHAFYGRDRGTRRDFLQAAATVGLGYALARGTAGPSLAGAAASPSRGGVLRVGWIPNAHTL